MKARPAKLQHAATNVDREDNHAPGSGLCCNRTLEELIKAVFASHDRTEMLKRLDAAGIASGAVNDVASLSDHPQLDRSVIGTPSGEINVPTPPIRRSLGETALGPCPAFDAEGEAIRAEFGPLS